MKRIRTLLFCLQVLVLLSSAVRGQAPQMQSPYSKLGLGDYQNDAVLPVKSMGNLSAVFHDEKQLNAANPAAYAFLKTTVLDVGVSSGRYGLREVPTGLTDHSTETQFDYFQLGISLVNDYNRELEGRKSDWRFGTGIGIAPYTRVGYEVESVADGTQFLFSGTGGTYQINWNTAAKYKNFSVGIGWNFMRGHIDEKQKNNFQDTVLGIYNNVFSDAFSVKGQNVRFGLLYDYYFKDSKKEDGRRGDLFSAGIFVQPGFDMPITATRLATRVSTLTRRVDTLQYEDGARYETRIPLRWGIGVGYGFKDLYRLGINYEGADWTDFELPFKKSRFGRAARYALGYEKQADLKRFDDFWKRVSLRGGLFYGKDPRFVNGEQITYGGITIGMGIPVILPRQDVSFFNVGIEAGRNGTRGGLRRTYIKLSLSVSLTDKSWFFKQKYY